MDARTIGEKLTQAARLPGRALCVYGSEELPEGSVQIAKVDQCVARAVYKLTMMPNGPPVHFGVEAKNGICPGGQGWCGLTPISPMTKFFISTGTPEFRHGWAEHLKPDPQAAERFLAAPGKILLPSRYLNIAGWDQLKAGQDVLSFILIGNAESIRNMGGLVQYVFEDIFGPILMPSGPSCASMVTYAAGLSENAPQNTAFVGPVDPTGNTWLPPDLLSMAIPFDMAQKMAENIEGSFLTKRSHIAFPSKRLGMNEKAEHD